MYILYDNNILAEDDSVEKLVSLENWALGLLDDSKVNTYNWSKYRAVEMTDDLAYGSLFFDCCTKWIEANGAYVKYFPSEIGEKNGFVNNIWGNVLANSSQSAESLKHMMTAEDETKAVAFSKFYMKFVAGDIFDGRLSKLGITSDNLVEQASWESQKEEALAVTNDASAPTPVLDILSAGKGITVAELATQVLAKVAEHNVAIATLLASQQNVMGKVDACTTNEECIAAREDLFGVIMPVFLAVRLGRLSAAEQSAYDELEEKTHADRTVPDTSYGVQF
jgi:hypothetical protein